MFFVFFCFLLFSRACCVLIAAQKEKNNNPGKDNFPVDDLDIFGKALNHQLVSFLVICGLISYPRTCF